MFLSVTFTIAAAHLAVNPQGYSTDLTTWVEATPPAPNTPAYETFAARANRSRHLWYVTTDGKKAQGWRAIDVPYTRPPRPDFRVDVPEVPKLYRSAFHSAIKVEDGWLVGYNRSRYGAVWWFSSDGTRRYEIASPGVNQFVQAEGETFAVLGTEMFPFWGPVIRFERKAEKWVGTEFALLPEMGLAACCHGKGELAVVTKTKLLRVNSEGKVEVIIENATWFDRPTSVQVAPAGTIYVGMRQLVAAIDPKQPRVRLLVPSREFLKSDP